MQNQLFGIAKRNLLPKIEIIDNLMNEKKHLINSKLDLDFILSKITEVM